MNDRFLEDEYFPALVRKLRQCGEVFVEFSWCSQFSHHLMRHDFDLWMATEQEPGITDDDRARFYVRHSSRNRGGCAGRRLHRA